MLELRSLDRSESSYSVGGDDFDWKSHVLCVEKHGVQAGLTSSHFFRRILDW